MLYVSYISKTRTYVVYIDNVCVICGTPSFVEEWMKENNYEL